MANVQLTKDKLSGTKVQNLDGGRVYLVDKALNSPLHTEISSGDLLIPTGYLIILKDGSTVNVRLGVGKNWANSVVIAGPGSAAPTPAQVATALSTSAKVAALISPTADYANLTAVTAAVKSIIDALKTP